MKTKFKFFSLLLAMVMVIGMTTVSASAAEKSTSSEVAITTESSVNTVSNNYPYPSSSSHVYVSSDSWTMVANSSSGFNCNVVVGGLVVGNYFLDVLMLDRNGNTVWTEENAVYTIGNNNGSRKFWCGSNVYQILVKGHNGNGIAWAYPA